MQVHGVTATPHFINNCGLQGPMSMYLEKNIFCVHIFTNYIDIFLTVMKYIEYIYNDYC